ncbi:hypothetical protein GJ699_31660 [Duganella sp. FT80W]|uniref:Uncharacterized protein n=1 Tax=Duganella guangzhouensis TaxID=2666084 RepID=A0A6I2L8G9_9BURK|nr:hypothetical protein [Duganella guangzhouensis]MRW94535.1 hypothetical protein [Duganella guangzhouensis]
MNKRKIDNTAEVWEAGLLGRDEAHTESAPNELDAMVDDTLGLECVSIRLQRELVNEYKRIADERGVGYLSLMRDALQGFARTEFTKAPKQYTGLV